MADRDIQLSKLASCAGCGAKVGAGTLAKLLEGLQTNHDPALIVGFERSDDAAVYRISDTLALVQTIDFFPPIADDPYTFGAIAAANALSDIYAMGGEPKLALNMMAVPQSMPQEMVREILRGGYDKVYEAGAVIAGGHSIFDDEPKYGLSVTGFVHPEKVLTNSGAQIGDVLILTKALGTGILTTAAKGGLIDNDALAPVFQQMMTLNRAACHAMLPYRVHACTDITGFGLLGHCFEMAQGSAAAIRIDTAAVPLLDSAVDFAQIGILPEGMYRNRQFVESEVFCEGVELAMQDVLYDPQTSGGLLIAVDAADALSLMDALRTVVPQARKIGEVVAYTGDHRIYLT